MKVALAVAPVQDHPLTRALGFASELADQPPLVALNSLVLATALLAGKPRLARAGARMLMAHLLATGIKHVVKRTVDRTRPYVIVDGGEYEMKAGSAKRTEMNSFPSGHTAGAVAVAQALGREFPDHARAAAGAAAAVAVLQIPRCAHYPSDIAAGAAIGSFAEAVVGVASQPLLGWIEDVAKQRARQLGRVNPSDINLARQSPAA